MTQSTTPHIHTVALELGLAADRIGAVAQLLEAGATVPFISRYRKEATGSLDEVAIAAIKERLKRLAELDLRREAILDSLLRNGHLTDPLKEKVLAAETLAALEDAYLPFRPRRRTRGTMAREKGLEPLARQLFDQQTEDPEAAARPFVDPEAGVADAAQALAGARDIIAEWISEDSAVRSRLRSLYRQKGEFICRVATGKEQAGLKYQDYYDWREPAAAAPSHRILAMRRGEKEDLLNLSLKPPAEDALALVETRFVSGSSAAAQLVRQAAQDAVKRLLSRAMETEARLETKERADREAIRIFEENLRQLLLAPPLGPKRVMAVDPGFRTGCKVVCLDRQGRLLHHDTVYPHLSERQTAEAGRNVIAMVRRFEVAFIAVGNGTAGRETESFLRSLELPQGVETVMVNESGASIYSASDAAREEFPDLDLTIRGAVSIGRRLMDPLAELVKIDPKSIGVGQYQHDVDQNALKEALDAVVVSCVNKVGVDVNTASAQLLTYVSGLGPQLARNIVAYRNANGAFRTRDGLKAVPRLGPKAFEQCAGFLRIRNGDNPLDASAVHPESYWAVERMAADLSCHVADLIRRPELRDRIDPARYVSDRVGLPTLRDIMAELAKPGRDPRAAFEAFRFTDGIEALEDLRPGMTLPGIVTNITAFGAFVDIGVHQDGLVHVSQLADRFVKDPARVVKVSQKVSVTVLEVDLKRRRIALSMRSDPAGGRRRPGRPVSKQKAASPPKRPGRNRSSRRGPFNNPFADALRKTGKG
jgi:uncharacterized protein